MVTVDIRSAQHPEPAATIEADAHGCRIDGPQLDLIDVHEPLLGLHSGRRVTAEEAPEEWARGLIVRYRSPDLSARIVYDDDPLSVQHPPIRLDEPARR